MRVDINNIICPNCRVPLRIKENFLRSSMLECSCSVYPEVWGILYLKRDRLRKKIVRQLERGNEFIALISMTDIRRAKLIFLSPIIVIRYYLRNNRSNTVNGERSLFFNFIVRFFALFSNQSWYWYLVNRKRIPSYFFALAITNLVRKGEKVVDFGCGAGQLLANLSLSAGESNVIGVDLSTQNLLMARMFFASRKTLLICADAEVGLPLKNNSVNLILSTDSFHYIKNKELFVSEANRIIKPSGLLTLVHVLKNKERNIKGLSSNKMLKMLKTNGFGNNNLLSNGDFWHIILEGKKRVVPNGNYPTTLELSRGYNVMASKNKKQFELGLNGKQTETFNKTKIRYHGEEEVLYLARLIKLFETYDSFMFISPHLDDAILSCSQIIEWIAKYKKKVKLVSVFTEASSKPYSPQALKHLRESGYKNGLKFMEARKREDLNACKALGVKPDHLGYIDASWRKSMNNKLLYKNEDKQFGGSVSAFDSSMIAGISNKISSQIYDKTLLFCPIGIGRHVDHLIIRRMVENLTENLVYWKDVPYSFSSSHNTRSKYLISGMTNMINVQPSMDSKKIKAINAYKSQVKSLFGSTSIPNYPDEIFISSDSKLYQILK